MSLREQAYAVTGSIRKRVVPELRYSQTQYEEYLRANAAGIQSWLDVGCGHQLLPPWRAAAEAELLGSVERVVGIDYDLDSLRRHANIRNVCRADVGALPFADESFDLVTANMVVEHLDAPEKQFREVRRVLRPGGAFLFHTPNELSYPVRVSKLLPDGVKKTLARVLEGRAEEDVFPTHYRANREEVIRRVAASAGLEVGSVNYIGTLPTFAAFPPVAAAELLLLRQLMRRPSLEKYRQTLICVLRRPAARGGESAGRAAEAVTTPYASSAAGSP
jgi:SAM-dependent methyltransferase